MKHWPVQDAKARFSELLDAERQGRASGRDAGAALRRLWSFRSRNGEGLTEEPRNVCRSNVLLHDPRRGSN